MQYLLTEEEYNELISDSEVTKETQEKAELDLKVFHSKVQYKFEYIQIWQKNPGIVNIKLVPWKFDSPLNGYKKQIKKDFQEKLKTVEVMTEICTKDELYISHRGKVPYLVSEVKQARNY